MPGDDYTQFCECISPTPAGIPTTPQTHTFFCSLPQAIDAGSNAVPLFLAAQAHGATQLAAMCEYWMARELPEAEKHEQWAEVSDAVRARMQAEHTRLIRERLSLLEARSVIERLPCLLATLTAPPAPAP